MRSCRLSRCRSNAIWGVWWKNPVQKKNKAMEEAIVRGFTRFHFSDDVLHQQVILKAPPFNTFFSFYFFSFFNFVPGVSRPSSSGNILMADMSVSLKSLIFFSTCLLCSKAANDLSSPAEPARIGYIVPVTLFPGLHVSFSVVLVYVFL